ncbi:MAG: MFS transporter [Deltaproteobacteria bacterium]|nr:MFS transporter [Deltaproteobacteria bacterium]
MLAPLRQIRDRNVWLLYGATVLLGLAYGLAIALIGLYLDGLGYQKTEIGLLAFWFALGTVSLALPMGALIRRFTAKRVLVVCFFGYACTVGAFPFLESHTAIVVDRFLDGAFSVGVWISSETILLQRAGKDHKAFIMSLYGIAVGIGYVVGPLAAHAVIGFAPYSVAFGTSAVLAVIASLWILLRLDPDPRVDSSSTDARPTNPATRSIDARPLSPPRGERQGEGRSGVSLPAPGLAAALRSSLALVWRIRISCWGTFSYGYFQASIVLFMPLFLRDSKGIAQDDTVIMPAFFAAGLLIFSSIAGRIADRFGHLVVMRTLAMAGACLIGGFLFVESFAVMCLITFLGGAVLASISPISLALQGNIVAPEDYSRANSIYNTFYATGTLVGPVVSSFIFDGFGGHAAGKKLGGETMMGHMAVLWAIFAIVTWFFRRDDPRAGHDAALAAARVESPSGSGVAS